MGGLPWPRPWPLRSAELEGLPAARAGFKAAGRPEPVSRWQAWPWPRPHATWAGLISDAGTSCRGSPPVPLPTPPFAFRQPLQAGLLPQPGQGLRVAVAVWLAQVGAGAGRPGRGPLETGEYRGSRSAEEGRGGHKRLAAGLARGRRQGAGRLGRWVRMRAHACNCLRHGPAGCTCGGSTCLRTLSTSCACGRWRSSRRGSSECRLSTGAVAAMEGDAGPGSSSVQVESHDARGTLLVQQAGGLLHSRAVTGPPPLANVWPLALPCSVVFTGEEGVDAGGVTREWFSGGRRSWGPGVECAVLAALPRRPPRLPLDQTTRDAPPAGPSRLHCLVARRWLGRACPPASPLCMTACPYELACSDVARDVQPAVLAVHACARGRYHLPGQHRGPERHSCGCSCGKPPPPLLWSRPATLSARPPNTPAPTPLNPPSPP